ncbi:MAG: pyridoxal 5-phosphate synthase pdxT subunit [Candidatus Methanomethylophilaceae archaeon]|nr:pyridoxal 5-phosphate synthase pdxT subunit [Candidatus Methanomethylophilaceae archaeon]MDI3542302.1 pyridoxal 5-phosphate synthase pdxT subunit [Candidatus Methanomethylophilaceae archaeon]
MTDRIRAGVLSLQGAALEHINSLKEAMRSEGRAGEVFEVRNRKDLEGLDCLVIPGGESTTISKLMKRFGMTDAIRDMAHQGVPIMGTCAGCILMAKEGDVQVERSNTELLGIMDMKVRRNTFGRQGESFEAGLNIEGLEGEFPAVFIRAPVIEATWGECRPLAILYGKTVMVRQGKTLATSFHPELSTDIRIHRMLLNLI